MCIDIELDCSEPAWLSADKWLPVEQATIITYKVLDNMTLEATQSYPKSNIDLKYLIFETLPCQVQVMPKPFARGSFRLAYWLKVVEASSVRLKFVAKKPIISKDGDLVSCRTDIVTQVYSHYCNIMINVVQLYAKQMADKFRQNTPNMRKTIEFEPIHLLFFHKRSTPTCILFHAKK